MLVNIIVYSLQSCVRPFKPPLAFNDEGELIKPSPKTILILWRPTFFYMMFYLVTIVGVTLFLHGNGSIRQQLYTFYGTLMDEFVGWTNIMAVFIIVIDTVFLIALWIASHDILLCQLMTGYHEAVDEDTIAAEWESKRFIKRPHLSLTAFRFMHAVLFASLILAALAVVFGCVNVGIAYGLTEICVNTAVSLGGRCFDMVFFCFDPILCGTDFQDACGDLDQKQLIITLWGSFVIIAGHFYLISSAGAVEVTFKNTLSALSALSLQSKKTRHLIGLRQAQQQETEEMDRRDVDNSARAAEAAEVPPSRLRMPSKIEVMFM